MKACFLVVDKPAGVTSHDVVAAVRAVTGFKKVGHTGTLDPFATGVLPLALGSATRLIQFLDESIKVYDAVIAFGSKTDTGDPTGEVIATAPLPDFSAFDVASVLRSFVGKRMQTPPPYSAVKVKGKALYRYARKGETVEVAAREITISDVELLEVSPQQMRVVLSCSRGTYARVLADDIAVAFGSTGHLASLSRLRSGPFVLKQAISIEELASLAALESGHAWREVLMARKRDAVRVKWKQRDEVLLGLKPWLRRPVDFLSHLPLADVEPSAANKVNKGFTPPPPPGVGIGGRYLVVSGDTILAVAEKTARGPSTVRVLGSKQ